MQSDASAGTPDPFDAAGLCARCRHAQRVESANNSRFILCRVSKTDGRFPKYPRLPMINCSAYEEERS